MYRVWHFSIHQHVDVLQANVIDLQRAKDENVNWTKGEGRRSKIILEMLTYFGILYEDLLCK